MSDYKGDAPLALIVVESEFGSTRKIADAVSDGLGALGPGHQPSGSESKRLRVRRDKLHINRPPSVNTPVEPLVIVPTAS